MGSAPKIPDTVICDTSAPALKPEATVYEVPLQRMPSKMTTRTIKMLNMIENRLAKRNSDRFLGSVTIVLINYNNKINRLRVM